MKELIQSDTETLAKQILFVPNGTTAKKKLSMWQLNCSNNPIVVFECVVLHVMMVVLVVVVVSFHFPGQLNLYKHHTNPLEINCFLFSGDTSWG